MNESTKTQDAQDLTIHDLATMKAIIDIASERSTFKAAEMAAVGAVYNKLDQFLKAVEEQQKATADEKNSAEATEKAGEDNE